MQADIAVTSIRHIAHSTFREFIRFFMKRNQFVKFYDKSLTQTILVNCLL